MPRGSRLYRYILIDPDKHTVTEGSADIRNLQTLYDLVGCTQLEWLTLVGGHVLHIDELAREREQLPAGFALGGLPLLGRALISGRTGSHFSAAKVTLDVVRAAVEFDVSVPPAPPLQVRRL